MAKWLTRLAAVSIVLFLAGRAAAANDKQIRASIDKAVKYLQSVDNGGEDKLHQQYYEGPMALTGLALLEAGVSRDDPQIQNMARTVRKFAVTQSKTYQLALDIMFLDKIGDEVDTALIQAMGVRLLAGQSQRGGWSYESGRASDQERTRLEGELANPQMKAAGNATKPKPSEPRPEHDPNAERPKLHPDLESAIRRGLTPPMIGMGIEDNSNSQFAILGLWAARRHGVPVEAALDRAARRFRSLQQANGGWGYPELQTATPGMTCAALIALAVGIGSSGEHKMRAARPTSDGKPAPKDERPKFEPLKADAAVTAGFNFVGMAMAAAPQAGWFTTIRSDLYFLWSLERACMVFNMRIVGGRDWHAWGADILVQNQRPDGSWSGTAGHCLDPEVSTAMAVMFLCRANLVRDLTNLFKMKAKADVTAKPSKELQPGGGAPAHTSDDASAEKQVAELVKELVAANPEQLAGLLKKFADPSASKGSMYTLALAQAIPQLPAEVQKKAREALQDRLSDTGPDTIRHRMRDENAELRRAAAIAAAMREEKELIPDLIEALADPEEIVVRAARAALKSFSKEDFGPAPNATEAQRAKAISDWREWWKKQSK
jgi:hypothetical protein